MILSIGEVLADMIGENFENEIKIKAFCGGAPFNVAVNAKQSGAKVGFIGRVGKDAVGKFLISVANKAGLDFLNIQVDGKRNTTLAFVSLKDGERDFSFLRNDTADYNIDVKKIPLSKIEDLNIIHLGSLMLSERKGIAVAKSIVKKTKKLKKILSFDVNFRLDLFNGLEGAIKSYSYFVEKADILKFSEDEIIAYTGRDNLNEAINLLYKKDKLLLITLGDKGSMYVYNTLTGVIDTEKVNPIDTTGAGDAFFGTVLAELDGKPFTKENIENALRKGNLSGAKTTQFLGAIKI